MICRKTEQTQDDHPIIHTGNPSMLLDALGRPTSGWLGWLGWAGWDDGGAEHTSQMLETRARAKLWKHMLG